MHRSLKWLFTNKNFTYYVTGEYVSHMFRNLNSDMCMFGTVNVYSDDINAINELNSKIDNNSIHVHHRKIDCVLTYNTSTKQFNYCGFKLRKSDIRNKNLTLTQENIDNLSSGNNHFRLVFLGEFIKKGYSVLDVNGNYLCINESTVLMSSDCIYNYLSSAVDDNWIFYVVTSGTTRKRITKVVEDKIVVDKNDKDKDKIVVDKNDNKIVVEEGNKFSVNISVSTGSISIDVRGENISKKEYDKISTFILSLSNGK